MSSEARSTNTSGSGGGYRAAIPAIPSTCGHINMSLSVDSTCNTATVLVHDARGIPSRDRGGAHCTQLRIICLPNKKQKFKTKPQYGVNPEFNERFKFAIDHSNGIREMGILLRLHSHNNNLQKDWMIAETMVMFYDVEDNASGVRFELKLEPRLFMNDRIDGNLGGEQNHESPIHYKYMSELLIGLSYDKCIGKLIVEIIKGSNLKERSMRKPGDTFVKVSLMSYKGRELSSSKTSVRYSQPNPMFKEPFIFCVGAAQLQHVTLMVSIFLRNKMKKDSMLGWFSLGCNSSGEEEQSHWNEMQELGGEQATCWHILLEP